MKVDCAIIGGGIVGSSVGIAPLRRQGVLKRLDSGKAVASEMLERQSSLMLNVAGLGMLFGGGQARS
jgi:L-2-hydroxyglutarate oxidase LhgO